MKKGIVLMMTLGFIAVITALILWSLSIAKDRFDKVSSINAQNQFNIAFKDFSNVFKMDFNSTDMLKQLLSLEIPGSVVDPKTGISIDFHPNSLMNRLNINYMLKTIVDSDNNVSKKVAAGYYNRALLKFLSKYELSDPFAFLATLLDSVDLDTIERANGSEIAEDDLDFRQGKLFDFNQLKKIENRYYFNSSDPNVYKITQEEFENYFYFGDTHSYGLLDCSQEKPFDKYKDTIVRVMSIIVDNEMSITEDTQICKDVNATNMKTLKKIYNISQYSNKSKYLVRCNIIINSPEREEHISFDYEVNSKRISNIDKSFQ